MSARVVYSSLTLVEGEKIRPFAPEFYNVWWSESSLSFSEKVTTVTPALDAPMDEIRTSAESF